MQVAAPRAFIQRLNIFQPMFESITAKIDFVFRHRIKHERIVRIRRVAQGEHGTGGQHQRMVSVGTGRATNHPQE